MGEEGARQKAKRSIKLKENNVCVFCQIVAGKEKSSIVFEDTRFICLLDRRPLNLGHCLIIPKKHFLTLYDLPQALIKQLFLHVKDIGKAIETAMRAEGSFVAINNRVSQSVPHLHVHVVPRNYRDGLIGFFWPRKHYQSVKEMQEICARIRKNLKQPEKL